MKVGLFIYGMLGGGMESILINIASFLKSKNIDITIVTTEVKGGWFSNISENGINSYHIDSLEYSCPVSHVFKVASYINYSKYDVVFINNARFVQASIPLINKNIIVIPIIHNNDPLTYELNSFYSSRCSGYVAVSPLIYKELIKRIPKEKVYLIPNGINEHIFPKNRSILQTNYNKIKLLFVGRLFHEEKGIFLLPEILKEIVSKNNNVFLDIIGAGTDERELKEQFNNLGLTGNVEFFGMLPIEKVYERMSNSHILIFPSLREGFGLVLAEAQLYGCVPVASYIKDVTDYIVNDKENGFLVEMGNPRLFVEKIMMLTENNYLLKLMSEKAQKNAIEKFSMNSFGSKYLKLINDIRVSKPCWYHSCPEFQLDKTIKIISTSNDLELASLYGIWIRKLYEDGVGITAPLSRIGIKNVAIFGTLKTSHYLLHDLNQQSINVLVFLDNNKELFGSTINGIPIATPYEWLSKNNDLIDMIILSIESKHDKELKEELSRYYNKNRIISWKSLLSEKC
ncbi:glycosyltransferase [Bacillus sp. CGMCC 1.16607]|uniref:glycosyltransferase n=1 Tax=Bacillus sp. CGMCC 1.16607 TaxID=3351842 RepID=UPI003636CCC4